MLSINVSVDVGVCLNFVEGLFNNVQFLLNCEEGGSFMYNSNKKVTTNLLGPLDLLYC